jgi:hypothetical protein
LYNPKDREALKKLAEVAKQQQAQASEQAAREPAVPELA